MAIQMLGGFSVSADGRPLDGLQRREGRRLLAFLILQRGEPVEYRTLAERFWPAEARSVAEFGGGYDSARQAIHSLRTALGPDAERLQSVNRGVLRFDCDGLAIDLAEFDRLIRSESPADWKAACALYGGPLLDGWTDTWVLPARQRRQREYERLQERLRETPEVSPVSSASPDSPPGTVPARLADGDEPAESLSLEPESGAMALDSRFYIRRPIDTSFFAALDRQDAILLIQGARQMGKTSLMARGLDHRRSRNGHVVVTDFQSLPAARLESVDALYFGLAASIARQLRIDGPRQDWDEDFDASTNLEEFLRRVLADRSLVWGMDEVDRLFSCPFGSEVFGLIRSWYNRRALEPQGIWSRLTLVIAYATEVHLFISDINQSPFNVGTRFAVTDFTRNETEELNRRYGSPLRNDTERERFYRAFSGHPYLSRLALNLMVGQRFSLGELERMGQGDESPFHNHLRRFHQLISSDDRLETALQAVLAGRAVTSVDAFYRLRSAGLIVGEPSSARLRCGLYADFFAHRLGANGTNRGKLPNASPGPAPRMPSGE
ncbi:MAG: AAA-like domain-containing protein [Capsulimonadales bacterium]|nr:AAA-like domain-containing protein [Capsulimonadales bacterium]